MGFSYCFLVGLGFTLGSIRHLPGSFLVGLGSNGFDQVAVEFKHSFYVLFVASGGEGKNGAVYTVVVGFIGFKL